MIIVGINGDIDSGKTTFANYLDEQLKPSEHWESWQIIAEVAQKLRTSDIPYPTESDLNGINQWLRPLPKAVEEVVHRSIAYEAIRLTPELVKDEPADYARLFEHLSLVHDNPSLQRTEVTAANKETFRTLLQWIGGFLIKKSDDGLWYEEILRRIAARPELELATISGLRYPGESDRLQQAGGKSLRMVRPSLKKRDATDLTERQSGEVPVNGHIINDATLHQLKLCSAKVLEDLKRSELSDTYQASNF